MRIGNNNGRNNNSDGGGNSRVHDGDFSFGGGGGGGGGGTTTSYGDGYYYDEYIADLDVEIRPARRRDAVEAGLDYWIDESDLTSERKRRIALRDRRRKMWSAAATTTASGGDRMMPMRRLREEVAAPYKQNWIGWMSAFVVALSAIVTKFPELLQIPIIPIPDL